MPKCVGGITWPKYVHAQSSFWASKTDCIIHFDYTLGRKKRSLRNEKLKANRASETEEQRKERLRIRREKDRARRITKNHKRERKGLQKQKTTRNSAWPLSKD